ncbi:Grx4 family monothiol glutaredoxin [Candidatus Tachikawaea gelatinosa]|uniref:Glutaredoxin n=1 Tax=Candidatus Tachikawaea gelatinosa TaxID=1410383 RepID=A0A090AJL5_9ENTR|nr:Grx4 family monothiol glutaredoxin [Candidatus Tachikawaea gelatinosa]BAP58638.1 glutaredoxin [Candidatus Tachikawaea gelatinosa]
MNLIFKKIESQILSYPVLIYMKGSPNSPSCGFSAQAIKILSTCIKNFKYIDVLKNTDIRKSLPHYAKWPTFPQLWVNGKLIGGCDIMLEMFRKGTLQEIIRNAVEKKNKKINKI